ncbi:MAG: hypothetical protein D4R65_10795 [Verrucomicrobiaceae bacterium]|nr:MAG: hypothetical protein D4R65_10795 [Verrucomicrobiaceae bacterium]
MTFSPLARGSILLATLSPARWAVIGFAVLLLSLSNDSIDMDEAQTWDYARLGTFSAFCHELKTDSNSEAQMPLGMFSFWAWTRAFGTRELAMRSLNLLWAAIVLAALARVGRQVSIPWLPILFAIQPFTWYCMNHARTPLMQMAGGALLLSGTLGHLHRRQTDGGIGVDLCIGAVLLCGASMLGLVPLIAIVAGLSVHGILSRLLVPKSGKVLLIATLLILAALGIYYGSTLLRGAGGAKIWSVSPANILFVAYEFLGFQGLGPGRQELRSIMKGLSSARDLLPFLPGFLVLASAYCLILLFAFKSWMTRNPGTIRAVYTQEESPSSPQRRPRLFFFWLMSVGVSVLSACLLYVLAAAARFPFWGRHLAGVFPFWVLALAITIYWARQGIWRKAGRLAGGGLIVLLLASSILIRFAPFHRHDDYRGAVAEALRISSRGGIVWWVADHSGGEYYGLPLADVPTNRPGEIQFSMNRADSGNPDAIIISRPDNFDVPGTASRLIASGAYQKKRVLQAFEVWEKIR